MKRMVVGAEAAGFAGAAAAAAGCVGLGASPAAGLASPAAGLASPAAGLASLPAGLASGGAAPLLQAARITPIPPADARRNTWRRLSVDRARAIPHLRPRYLDAQETCRDAGNPT